MEDSSPDQGTDPKSNEADSKEGMLETSPSGNSESGTICDAIRDSSLVDDNVSNNATSKPDISASGKQCETIEIPMQGGDNSVSGIRKDDSGFYSEKSPNCANFKDSDGELSESISESFEDIGTDVDNGFMNNNKKNNVVEINKNILDEKTVDSESKSDTNKLEESFNNDLIGNDKIETSKETAKALESVAGTSVNTDSESTSDVAMGSIDGAMADIDTVNNAGESGDKSKYNVEDSCDSDLSDNETWPTFIRKNVKLKSKYKSKRVPGVDDDSDDHEVDSETASRPLHEGHRSYRKRKSDSDSENDEANSEGDSNKDANAESNIELDDDVDSTPVLLRHSALGSDLAVDSDSDEDSEHDGDVDDIKDGDTESASDGDDLPVDVSRFGPPKHKWRALFDLRQRERGDMMYKEPNNFRQGVQGSLQMVKRFDLQFKMDHHEGCVNALHFNSIGTLLASGSDDLNIVIWDWMKKRPALIYDSGHRSNVFQSKFMPFSGDAHVVSCARDGMIRLADLSSTGVCKGTKKIAQHRGAAHKLALEIDSPHVVLSCGEDAVTFEIDLRSDKPNRLVTTKEDDKKVAMYSIHSNPVNSNEFCLGGRDNFIRIYDKRNINEAVNNGLLKKFCPHHIASAEKSDMKANVTCACYNYNGTEVLGTYNDEDIYLFNNDHSDSAEYIHRYRGHRNNQTVKGVNFYGPHSEFIVSGSDCGHIFLWDKATENIVQYLDGDEGGVINVLEPHPFAPVLATSGLDHDVKIWAPTLEAPTKLNGLKRLIKRNGKEREDERSGDGSMVDGSMLWFIMHQLRRSRRRREREARAARGDDEEDDTSDTLSDEDTTPDDTTDSDGGGPQDRLQCATS